jgi:hypothetical protein
VVLLRRCLLDLQSPVRRQAMDIDLSTTLKPMEDYILDSPHDPVHVRGFPSHSYYGYPAIHRHRDHVHRSFISLKRNLHIFVYMEFLVKKKMGVF